MERRTTRKDSVAPNPFRVESPGDVFGCADLRNSYQSMQNSKAINRFSHDLTKILTKPCLLAVYAIPAAAPLTPALLLTLTIQPCFLACKKGSTSRIILIGAVKLTAMTWSHSASVMVSTKEKLSITPATLARTSIRSLLWFSRKSRNSR
jgi:hypothetical protein